MFFLFSLQGLMGCSVLMNAEVYCIPKYIHAPCKICFNKSRIAFWSLLKAIFNEKGKLETGNKQTVKFASLSDCFLLQAYIALTLCKPNCISHGIEDTGLLCKLHCSKAFFFHQVLLHIVRTIENFAFYGGFLIA